MAFNIIGSIITQTGTDNDLSGLQSIAGVDFLQVGSSFFPETQRTFYKIPANTRLVVEGTLTMNPETEELAFENAVANLALTVANGGVFNIGQSITRNAFTRYSYGTAIHFADQNKGQSDDAEANFEIEIGGTVNWYGGIIFMASGTMVWRGTMNTFSQENCVLLRANNETNADIGRGQIRMRSSTSVINGLTSIGSTNSADQVALIDNAAQFSGYRPIHLQRALTTSGSTPSDVTFDDFAPLGCDFDYAPFGTRKLTLNNPENGSDLTIDESGNGTGGLEVNTDLVLNIVDENNINLGADAKWYFIDTDSGVRFAPNLADVAYTGTSGQTVSIRSVNVGTSGVDVFDRRLQNLDTSDEQNIPIISYLHGITSISVVLKTIGGVTANPKLFLDSLITETSKAVVEAYTVLDTAQKSYDFAKSYLFNNYLGESATIVSRAGQTIEAGNKNITIDNLLPGAFTFTDPLITFKTTSFLGVVETTGTINGIGEVSNLSVKDATVNFDTAIAYTGSFNNITANFQAAGIYDFRGASFIGTFTVGNTSGGAVTLLMPQGITVVNNGPSITVDDTLSVNITAANLIDGTRYQLYNVTQGSEIAIGLVSGGSGLSYNATLGVGQDAIAGDVIRLRATYQNGITAKLPLEVSGQITVSGLSFIESQTDDAVYISFGVDGSLVSNFSADYANDEIDIIVGSNFNVSDLYSWYVYNLTTVQGIQEFFGGIEALNEANFQIKNSIINILLDNTTATNIRQLDNRRIYREDGMYPVKDPTTGGGGIDVVWRNTILVAETGVSGLTPQESALLAEIANIKSKTDLLSFTGTDVQSIASNMRGTDGAVTSLQPVIDLINTLNDLGLGDIEASSILAKEATLNAISTAIAQIPTTDSVADLTGVLANLGVINRNVKKASLAIPANEDL